MIVNLLFLNQETFCPDLDFFIKIGKNAYFFLWEQLLLLDLDIQAEKAGKITLFKFQDIYSNFSGVRIFRIFTVIIFSITESLGDNVFDITVISPTDNRVRVYKQMSDVRDGSYIFRYRLFGTYDTLIITILYNGEHVARSPYTLEGKKLFLM